MRANSVSYPTFDTVDSSSTLLVAGGTKSNTFLKKRSVGFEFFKTVSRQPSRNIVVIVHGTLMRALGLYALK